MVWQDIIISITNLFFAFALIPQIYKGFKLKKSLITPLTSGITFVSLYTIGITFFTLFLYYSSIMSFICGTLWLILFIQHFKYKNN